MRNQIHNSAATPAAPSDASEAPRRLRSLVLAWHDEESGDDLTVDVRGSERFLKGLVPLGFVPLGKLCEEDPTQRAAQHPSGQPSETTEHRVHWTVRLSRHWNPKSR